MGSVGQVLMIGHVWLGSGQCWADGDDWQLDGQCARGTVGNVGCFGVSCTHRKAGEYGS